MKIPHKNIWNVFISLTILIYSCTNADSDLKIDYPPGGYEFSKNITNKDFYHYPLIGKISRRDSFNIAYNDAYFFHLFKEPNISLQPADKTIFRLICKSNTSSHIISLTEDKIIVKKSNEIYWPQIDPDKLTEIERKHWDILKKDFPIDEVKSFEVAAAPLPTPDQRDESIRRKKEYDSIIINTPELLNPQYYDYLLKKAAVNKKVTFSFSINTIEITKEDFKRIVDLFNKSGYWKMPYESNSSGVTDATFYLLEANNGKKYNAVLSEDNFYDKAELSRACYELRKLAMSHDTGGGK